VPEPLPQVVDVVFGVTGTSVPADNAWPLARAVERVLPWLATEALAGIHPLRAAATTYGVALLAQRAKLVLRVPEARLHDCLALESTVLDLSGSPLAVGAATTRPLGASATLAAQRVTGGGGDMQEFEEDMRRILAALAIDCDFISGRAQHASAGGRDIAGFALALHGLAPADSLRVQREGIGGERRLGWGVFVPAKSIAAVRL
jgi:CRISPR-associated protein Cas6